MLGLIATSARRLSRLFSRVAPGVFPLAIGCIFAGTTLISIASAQRPPRTFNDYIVRAVEAIDTERGGGGYDINKAFTQDLLYGAEGVIPASRHPEGAQSPYPTMCVAAVVEAIVEAVNLYHADAPNDHNAFVRAPLATWRSGNLTSLRANIFRYAGTGSPGTAFALERAGIGRQKPFSELRRGDFINFNRRNGSGHAVIFWSYLTAQGETANYSDAVVGFRYFSAQGADRPDGGHGYRNGYFETHCPSPRVAGRDDCNIRRGLRPAANGRTVQDQYILNTGEMYHPAEWTSQRTAAAQRSLTRSVTRGLERQGLRGSQLRAAVRSQLERPLEERPELHVDGTDSE